MVSGTHLEFISDPPQPPREVVYQLAKDQELELNPMVQELINLGIVVECLAPKSLAGLFLRPKPEGKFRLIIDLSPLNLHLEKKHFKMESLQDALSLVEPNDWMCKLDLKNAYYSIPIAPEHQPYLAFIWQGRTWMFTRLCFGLSPAPRIFTKILKPLLKWLRDLGVKLVAYIDDFWLSHASKNRCREMTLKLAQRLKSLGFTVNGKKSIMEPVQCLIFLGMQLSSIDMTVSLPQVKRVKILSIIEMILKYKRTTPMIMARLIGNLEAIRPAFTLCPLYYRSIQRWMVSQQTRDGMLSQVTYHLRREQIEELEFWRDLLPVLKPQPVQVHQGTAAQLQSDASNLGWGVTLGSQVAHGAWSVADRSLHINVKEIRAVLLGLQTFGPQLRGQTVVIGADNTSCLAYIRRMGGVRNQELCQTAIQIWETAQNLQINLETQFIPGVENIRPDYLSRIQQDETKEWKLNRSTFVKMNRQLGPLRRDMFASHNMHHLNTYATWGEPHHMRNAFHHRWLNGDYLFPPFAVIGKVLRKVKRDQCSVVLIAPNWGAQPWYPTLQGMVSGEPMKLNYYRTLLRDPAGNPHPLGKSLNLVAWPIIGRN